MNRFFLFHPVLQPLRMKRLFIISLTLLLCLAGYQGAIAQVEDYKVKAGWIYALFQYTKWKAPGSSHSTLCTIGVDEVGSFLRQQQKEKSLPITIKEESSHGSLKACNIVYIGASEGEQIGDILQNLKDLPILTVSTVKGFAEMGGMVEIKTTSDKVSLRINASVVKNAQLLIDSDLLGISEIVD